MLDLISFFVTVFPMHLRDVCGNLANDLPSDLADVPPLGQEILQDTYTGTNKDTPGYIHRYIQRYWIMDMLLYSEGVLFLILSVFI